MTEAQRRDLVRIDGLLERLNEIDSRRLTEAEQEALMDVLASVYERTEYVLQTMKEEMSEKDKQPPCTSG